ncbi:TetR/AcrR family transcriptional regulator [Tomitella biformata]|uniref:TetR/AcrR family transcriptional regulator n=1 Tax=Tomitella biformata TaxID=630403 RepID=UPI000465DA3D|nr:TetR/AcrR family transcriptional regulator [Tomitella biformata]
MSDSARTAVRDKPATRNRANTRQRLLDAAQNVFATNGFGRSTVENVCERAGFSRGAFYSNFDSLDELFLAMWESQSEHLIATLRTAIEAESGKPKEPTVHDVIARILNAIPVDDHWYRITAEFSAHALRNPPLLRAIAAREQAIRETLLPIIIEQLAHFGMKVDEPQMLGRALVAMHDGTTIQALMEPGENTYRTELFARLILSYSSPERNTPDRNTEVKE